MPAIIYGVAIVDLLKIFSHRKNYSEMVAWGLMLMVYVIILWLELFDKLDIVTGSAFAFIAMVVKAIILSLAAAKITPEARDSDTKAYFMMVRKAFFLLIAALTLFNLFMQRFIYDDHRPLLERLLMITLFVVCAFVDKSWLRWSVWSITMGFLAILIVRIADAMGGF